MPNTNNEELIESGMLDVEHKIGNVYKTNCGHIDWFILTQLDNDGRFILVSLISGELYNQPKVLASNLILDEGETEEYYTITYVTNDELQEYMVNTMHYLSFYSEGVDVSKL